MHKKILKLLERYKKKYCPTEDDVRLTDKELLRGKFFFDLTSKVNLVKSLRLNNFIWSLMVHF